MALRNPQWLTLLWAWTGPDVCQRHLQPHPLCDFWRLKLGRIHFTSCVPLINISHGILQPETPTWTPKKRCCSSPGPSHWGPWDTGYGHAGEGTFKQHIWRVSGFWGKSLGAFFLYGFVCSELYQLPAPAVFSFLRKPTTKASTVIFPASSKQQPDCCQKPERCGVTNTSSFVLTLLSSASLKGKWTEKHIQRYKSPQSLRSEMGEEPCWEMPRGTWCCLFSPGLIYPWRETGREAPARFLFIFGLAAESVAPVPSSCQQCAWVTVGGLWAGLLDLSSCRAGNSTWIFFTFFFLLKAVLAMMSSGASTVNPHVPSVIS